MIHHTPIQDKKVEHTNWPTIRSAYADYEVTFVLLHPFLLIKPGCDIVFATGSWPSKAEINSCTEPVEWYKIIEQADLQDINELDGLLAYLHAARRTTDKTAWLKFTNLISKQNLVEANVDCLPEILANPIFGAIKKLGYTDVEEYTEWGELRVIHSISCILLSTEQDFYTHATITTPDKKILISTDFDQRFSYLSSSMKVVQYLIENAALEGFFCNEKTQQDWSYVEQTNNIIDWDSPERYINCT